MAPKLQCAKCKTTDSMEFIPIEYPEDDGTTTLHYGCTQCIDVMCDFVEARRPIVSYIIGRTRTLIFDVSF